MAFLDKTLFQKFTHNCFQHILEGEGKIRGNVAAQSCMNIFTTGLIFRPNSSTRVKTNLPWVYHFLRINFQGEMDLLHAKNNFHKPKVAWNLLCDKEVHKNEAWFILSTPQGEDQYLSAAAKYMFESKFDLCHQPCSKLSKACQYIQVDIWATLETLW